MKCPTCRADMSLAGPGKYYCEGCDLMVIMNWYLPPIQSSEQKVNKDV